jgi:hypothetical protein
MKPAVDDQQPLAQDRHPSARVTYGPISTARAVEAEIMGLRRRERRTNARQHRAQSGAADHRDTPISLLMNSSSVAVGARTLCMHRCTIPFAKSPDATAASEIA